MVKISASETSGISNTRGAVIEWLMCLPLTPGDIHTQGEWWPSGNVSYFESHMWLRTPGSGLLSDCCGLILQAK